MDVLAYLPRPLFARLRLILGQAHTLTAVDGWEELHALAAQRSIELVVVDPAIAGEMQLAEVLTLRERFPSLPLVVYTRLRQRSMSSIVRLARLGVDHVMLFGYDDDPEAFRDLLDQLPMIGLGSRMLEALAAPLATLPVAVRQAIEDLYRNPLRYRSAQDLAAAAGMRTRRMYRHLQPAGFHSPRLLVLSARLLRAYSDLQDPGRSIKSVAVMLGYQKPGLLTRQVYELTGMSMRAVREAGESDEFIARLAAEVRRGGAGVI